MSNPAYIIFIREKTVDQSELETYWEKIGPTFAGHAIELLSAYGPLTVLEGPNVEGVVIAKFPSVKAVRAWYDSPAYQAVKPHREKGAIYRGMIVEGTPTPLAN
jgi:uncharacterized protein (DUF1330 family)